jgi:alanine dehydrogenase
VANQKKSTPYASFAEISTVPESQQGKPIAMPIVITDEDAIRLLSIPEAIEAMRVAFRDLSNGKAVNPPRLRYSSETPDPKRRYLANIHAGAVPSYQAACVRAGSHFVLMDDRDEQRRTLDNPDPVNWSVIILYDLASGEPLAFMHETHLSGFRVGATTGLAVAETAREDAQVLGLFGTGNQAFPNCRAICAVRPIKRVQVYSPSRHHREAFVARMANEKVEVVALDNPREVVRGADVVCCATNAKLPVLKGEWLEPGQMVVTICNSDVLDTRSEVDEATFARASDIIVNDWDSATANRQVELLDPIEKGVVRRDKVYELGDIVAGKVKVRQCPDSILYYKNNTGLAVQFAACGAILYSKLIKEGTNRTIPREWFASQKYSLPPAYG